MEYKNLIKGTIATIIVIIVAYLIYRKYFYNKTSLPPNTYWKDENGNLYYVSSNQKVFSAGVCDENAQCPSGCRVAFPLNTPQTFGNLSEINFTTMCSAI